ncbi:MAG: efflux RND transporter periplasmic adaptor subunit [Clostridiaceae bacterium]|nr:efflux RND transporter periplasmic adaptor subunit [Clostridiaceae bacterium]
MKKKIILIGIFLTAAVIIGLILKQSGSAVQVELARVIRGDIEEYVEEKGVLMLEEETSIYSAASGRIIQVGKKAGEAVKAGEVLAKMDNADLSLQIKGLEAQKLSITAGYNEAKSPADEEISRLRAQLRSAEANYEESKRLAENNKTLYEAGAISLDTYKSSVLIMTDAEYSLEAAKSSLALAEKGASEYVRKQYEAQLSEVEAKIDQLRLKAEEMVIKSPIDGMVLAVEIKEGNIVQPGTILFEVGSSKGSYIESNVLIEDIAGIEPGSEVRIEDEDLGIGNVRGTVRKIHPKAISIMSDLGIEQKRIKVEINIEDTLEGLRPGSDMTVKIIRKSSEDTLIIDEKAVFDYQGKDHVFVNEGGTAKLRAIEKGIESDEMVEVLKGLKEGEEIILSPDETLEDGRKIKSKEA